jgi:hypothetical protein
MDGIAINGNQLFFSVNSVFSSGQLFFQNKGNAAMSTPKTTPQKTNKAISTGARSSASGSGACAIERIWAATADIEDADAHCKIELTLLVLGPILE